MSWYYFDCEYQLMRFVPAHDKKVQVVQLYVVRLEAEVYWTFQILVMVLLKTEIEVLVSHKEMEALDKVVQ